MIRIERFDSKGKPLDRAQRIQPGTIPEIADLLHRSDDGVTCSVADLTIHFKDGTKAVYTVVNERERHAADAG